MNTNVFGSAAKISDIIKPNNGVVLFGDKIEVGSRRYVPDDPHLMSRRDYLEKIDSPTKSIGKLALQNSEILNTVGTHSIQHDSIDQDRNFNSFHGANKDSLFEESVDHRYMKRIDDFRMEKGARESEYVLSDRQKHFNRLQQKYVPPSMVSIDRVHIADTVHSQDQNYSKQRINPKHNFNPMT